MRELSKLQIETTKSKTASGIGVVEPADAEARFESFLGMHLNNLRNVLFQCGGLNVDLILKLQAITGLVVVTERETSGNQLKTKLHSSKSSSKRTLLMSQKQKMHIAEASVLYSEWFDTLRDMKDVTEPVAKIIYLKDLMDM